MKDIGAELARLALARGWISAEAFERLVRAAERARAAGLEKSVDEILADEGLVPEKGLRELKEELGWTLRRSRIGDYEVIRRIGIGGTGTVFEARHVRLNVPVALKVLYPRFARRPELARRFLEEARNLASLSHPNLVHALDFGVDGEYCYLATEYVEGMDLRQKLSSEGPLGLWPALRTARDVARALDFLSSRGLVHRDVKPANILLGETGPAKLADAGLVKAVGELAGGERFAGGTPHYMAPEQVVRGGSVDARSDIYSLGATWYHMVAGRPPFAEFANEALLRAHLERRPPPPSSFRRGVPMALDRAILRWLSKDPADRPASPAKALEEIEELERELDPLARRIAVALGEGARRLLRRRALAAGLAAGILVLGAAAALWFSRPGEPRGESPTRVEAPPPRAPAGAEPSLAPRPAVEGEAAPPAEPLREPAAEPRAKVAGELPAEVVPAPVSPSAVRGARPLRAREVSARFERGLERLAELAAAAGRRWRDPSLEADARLLLGSFRAGFVALDARSAFPRAVLLRYPFDSPEELRDFRFAPGAFFVAEGRLRAPPGSRLAEASTVAWFAPPVRVEARLFAPAAIVFGFGSLRVAPGRGEDAEVWREGAPAPVGLPAAPAGTVAVRWSSAGLTVLLAGSVFLEDAAVPEAGRVSVGFGEGQGIEVLEIDGPLEPRWGAKRLELLRAERGAGR